MTAWAAIRRFRVAIALLSVFALPSLSWGADPPKPKLERQAKPTAEQLKDIAAKAEHAGDWEAAFNAYCHLFVVDRSALPDLRERLNVSLRRVQQLRRHRDPSFQQFATGMQWSGSLDLFAEVVQKVSARYADRDKATPQNLWTFAIDELDRALGNPTFRQVFLDNPQTKSVEEFRAELRRDWAKRIVTDSKSARSTLGSLISTAQDAFAIRVPAALAVECACGACSGLDEYTIFLTPSTGAEASVIPDLTSAGLYLNIEKNALVVDGIVPNSWVALNYPELKRGDRITRLNGRDMTGAGLGGAATALRYPAKGLHQLDIRGANDDVKLRVEIPVAIPTVYGERMMPDKPVGYARIGAFQPSTPRELDNAISFLKAQGAEAVVLDLRGNHGGSFLAAVETARRLLPAGVIVTTQGQLSEVANQVFSSSSGMSAHNIPLVLLIDAETASAAEVLTAALKDHDRAKIVGMPSFGKGSVQYPQRLVTLDDIDPTTGKKINKTGTVRVTIAKLIAPTSGPISGTGIAPHFVEADPTMQLELAAEKAEALIGQQMLPAPPEPLPTLPTNP
jgi:carboxyl-terminal processing protease